MLCKWYKCIHDINHNFAKNKTKNNFIRAYGGPTGSTFYFTGYISYFCLYENALNSAQINLIMYSAFLPSGPLKSELIIWITPSNTQLLLIV